MARESYGTRIERFLRQTISLLKVITKPSTREIRMILIIVIVAIFLFGLIGFAFRLIIQSFVPILG